jgi:Reverse transcriptase (RNA-dependent DNA polymerase)
MKNSSTRISTMILKETLSYYVYNESMVYCSFFDASIAFDRVNYCKLFRLLINRGLPPVITRILIHFHAGHPIRVVWNGLTSPFIAVLNGVKQGGVISPVLFCTYLDNLLVKLSEVGVGCHIGSVFVDALAYADDIVLSAPSAQSLRCLLAVCEQYASEYDMQFNVDKSKCMYFANSRGRSLFRDKECTFCLYGLPLDNAKSYIHLEHIISSTLSDDDDILYKRNCLIGQINSALCFFHNVNCIFRTKLLKAYCNSFYGSKLWMLDNSAIDDFCRPIAWRKGLHRALNLPHYAHSYTLPLLRETLPILTDICKRSARLIFLRVFLVLILVCVLSPGTVYMLWIIIHVYV